MDAPLPGGTRLRLRHLLAGIAAGVAGAIFVIVFLMLGSLWYRHSIWVGPNLFATAFYGADAYRNQFSRTSLSGVAVMVVMYGVTGAIWGGIWRDRTPRYRLFYGGLAGIITWFFLFNVFWKHVDPLLSLYAPDRQLEFATIIWGIIVARSPQLSRRMAAPAAEHGFQEEAVEVRSGEVVL